MAGEQILVCPECGTENRIEADKYENCTGCGRALETIDPSESEAGSTPVDRCDHPEWRGVTAQLKGHGGLVTFVVEQCAACGMYRKNDDPEFLEWEADDAES